MQLKARTQLRPEIKHPEITAASNGLGKWDEETHLTGWLRGDPNSTGITCLALSLDRNEAESGQKLVRQTKRHLSEIEARHPSHVFRSDIAGLAVAIYECYHHCLTGIRSKIDGENCYSRIPIRTGGQ